MAIQDRPDDIRRLSSWPNSTRAAFVRTLYHTLRLYSPRASLSLPLSKAAGGNWPAFKQPQSQCWSGAWGGANPDGLYVVHLLRPQFSGSEDHSNIRLDFFAGAGTLGP